MPEDSRAGRSVELRGSTGVLAYFCFACFLLGTALRLLVQIIGLPLYVVGLCAFLRHAMSPIPSKHRCAGFVFFKAAISKIRLFFAFLIVQSLGATWGQLASNGRFSMAYTLSKSLKTRCRGCAKRPFKAWGRRFESCRAHQDFQ